MLKFGEEGGLPKVSTPLREGYDKSYYVRGGGGGGGSQNFSDLRFSYFVAHPSL